MLAYYDDGIGVCPERHNAMMDLEPPSSEAQMMAHNGDGLKMHGFYLKKVEGIMCTFSNFLAEDGKVQRSCAMIEGDGGRAYVTVLELPSGFPLDGSHGMDELLGGMDEETKTTVRDTIHNCWCGGVNKNGVFLGNSKSPFRDLHAILKVSGPQKYLLRLQSSV